MDFAERVVHKPAVVVRRQRAADGLGRNYSRQVGGLAPDFRERLILGDFDFAAQALALVVDFLDGLGVHLFLELLRLTAGLLDEPWDFLIGLSQLPLEFGLLLG